MGNTATPAERASGVTVPARELHLVLDGLRRWFARVSGAGSRRIIGLLNGDAGLGKSLITRSLEQACDSLDLHWACARCPRRAPEPLGLVLDWIQQLVRREALELTDTERALFERLAPERQIAEPGGVELPQLEHELDRSRTVDTLACLLLRASRDKPLVLFLEDLHWVDGVSLDILVSVARMARKQRRGSSCQLLLVATCRPAELARRPRLAELVRSRHLAFEVSFRGYSRDDLRDAAAAHLHEELPLSLREELYQRSGASPRILYWAMKCLVPRREPGRPTRWAARWPRGSAPFRLEELLSIRHGKLLPAPRALLDLLAHMARPVHVEQLARMIAILGPDHPLAGQSCHHLSRLCHSLEIEGWLRHEGLESGDLTWALDGPETVDWLESVSPGSVKIHEAIGKALLERCRQARSAEWIFEALFHLERGGEPRERMQAGFLGAELAERRGAFHQALEIRDRILEDLDVLDAGELVPVCEKQARLLELAGVYREALDITRSLADGRLGSVSAEDQARYTVWQSRIYRAMEAPSQEARVCEEGLRHLPDSVDGPARWELTLALARTCWERGRRRESEKYFDAVIEPLLEAAGSEPEEHLDTLDLAQQVSFLQGRLDLAQRVETLRFEGALEVDRIEIVAAASTNLAQLYGRSGDLERAEEILFEALDRARLSGSRCLEARLEAQHGRLLRGRRFLGGALAGLERSRRILDELGLEEETGPILADLAFEKLRAFRFREALADFEVHVRRRTENQGQRPVFVHSVFPPVYAWARDREEKIAELELRAEESAQGLSDSDLRNLGDLYLDEGRIQDALRTYKSVMRSPRVIGNPIAMALTLQRMGRWMRLRGHYQEALQRYEKSLECLGPILEKSILARAYLEVGELVTIQGNLRVGYPYLLRALNIFLELDDPLGMSEGLLGLARFFLHVGMIEMAEGMSRCAAAISLSSSLPRLEAEALRIQGLALWRSGRSAESRQALMRSTQIAERLGLERSLARLKIDRGWIAFHGDDFERAIELSRSALEWARDSGDQGLLVDALHLIGAADADPDHRNKNFLRGLEALQQALEGAKGQRRVLTSRWILQSLSIVYAGKGKAELAGEYLREEAAVLRALRGRVQDEFWSVYSQEASRRAGSQVVGGSSASPPEIVPLSGVALGG